MATERPEVDNDIPENASVESAGTLVTRAEEPTAPARMSEDDVQRIQRQATELVKQVEDAAGSKELELLDGITNVGLQAQRGAAAQLELLKTRTGAFLAEGGTSKDIADGLRDLRVALDQINPEAIGRVGITSAALGKLPIFRERCNPVTRALRKIALRYEPVSRQIAHIEAKLRDGRALLVRDNIELRKLYEDVEAQQAPIQRNAYLGELLMCRLSEVLEQTHDPMRQDRVQGALHGIAMRVQGLRTMEEVHAQYFVSIEMTRQNNNRLGQSVEQTLTLATNVVTVGLAIQSALIRQSRVVEAAQRTREFLGNLIEANASAIKRHTAEIGDLYNSPVIAIEKVTQAHNDLIEALQVASRLRREGIEVARDNISKLTEMSAVLEKRVAGVLEEGDGRPESVEA